MLHHTHTHACVPVGDWQVFLNEERVGHVVWVVAPVEGQLARGSTVLHVHIKHKVIHLCWLLTEQQEMYTRKYNERACPLCILFAGAIVSSAPITVPIFSHDCL